MTTDRRCDEVQLELSISHDEGRAPSQAAADHLETCAVCAEFADGVVELEHLLATGTFDEAPDVSDDVMAGLSAPRRQWWSVAAVALVGITVGALVGVLGSRLDIGRAQDLHELFHTTGSVIEELSADVLIVERGVHPDVPERIYTGSLDYVAPEQLAIELIDTTDYPNDAWLPNDVLLTILNGDTLTDASSRCPVAALPGCLVPPSVRIIQDRPPFDEGIISPLQIVGPGRTLTWSSAVDVLDTPSLDGRSTIQVESTVAAVQLVEAITGQGSWRELHPTDRVVMWLDEETLVPLRIEVFAASSPERELWQLRHDYRDQLDSAAPLFIIQLSDLATDANEIAIEVPRGAPSQGFVDGSVDVPEPTLGPGFGLHRTGRRPLPDGGQVELASWSDGRSWLMIETTDDWGEPRLFGVTSPFVRPVDLGRDSVGFLTPSGDAVAIHTDDLDVLVSGSLPIELILEIAASLEVTGSPLPAEWVESSTIEADQLPPGTLVPDVDGWSILGKVEQSRTLILLTGGGSRTVLIEQEDGIRLDPPIGPDFSEVDLRDTTGRYDAATATLEWIEDGRIVRLRSETVGMAELLDLANRMERR